MNTENWTAREIKALRGRTFSRVPETLHHIVLPQQCRTVTRVYHSWASLFHLWIGGPSKIVVYWKRPGGRERKNPTPWPVFRKWLQGAVEIDTGG